MRKDNFMSPFNPSDDLVKEVTGIAKQKPKGDITDVKKALEGGLGREVSEYSITGQDIRIKERRNEGKGIVLKDGSVWILQEKRGKSPEQASYWAEKDLVIVKMWDEKYNDYIISNTSKRNESVWSLKGWEKETPQ